MSESKVKVGNRVRRTNDFDWGDLFKFDPSAAYVVEAVTDHMFTLEGVPGCWYEYDFELVPESICLPGVPEGYEAVRYDVPKLGDIYLDGRNRVSVNESGINTGVNFLIVRRIEPPKPTTRTVTFHEVVVDGCLMWNEDPHSSWHKTGNTREIEIPV